MRWVQTKLCWRALSRGAARGWAEEMTHLQTLSSAQMRKIPKILRLLGYTGTLSSAAVGLQVRTQPWQWPALWSTSVCLTLFSCGGFCLLYKTCSVPLTLVFSKWETSSSCSLLSMSQVSCAGAGRCPGAVWKRALHPGSPTLFLAGRHCLLLLGEHCTLLSSLHGKSILQVGGVITTCLGETLLALI